MIVVYDAHCLLCSGSIQFLLRHDRQGLLRFASMQGQTGRQLLAQAGVNPDDVDTVLFVRDGRAWRESAAVLRILHALGWPWALGLDRLVDPRNAARRVVSPRCTQSLSMVWAVRHLHSAAARRGAAVS